MGDEPSRKADFASGLTSSMKSGLKSVATAPLPTASVPPVAAGTQAVGKASAARSGLANARKAVSSARAATTDAGRAEKSGAQKAGEAVGEVASETVRGAVQGAVAGGVGAVPGAVKGAAVGAGKVALKSRTGKVAILAMIGATLIPLLLVTALITASVVNVSQQLFSRTGQAAQQVSGTAAMGAGMSQGDISTIMSAVGNSGVQWELVAAVLWAQHGTADNPYKFTVAADSPEDWSDLGKASKLVASMLVQNLTGQPGWSLGLDLANGATVTESGQVVWSSTDEHRAQLRAAFVTALAALPVAGASELWAGQVHSTALSWRLGLSSANGCTSVSLAQTTSPSPSPSPSTQPASPGLVVTSSSGEKVTVTTPMLKNVAAMVQVARQAGLSNQAILIAAMTMGVESKWLNLASKAVPESLALPNDGVVAGDHDSVNAFQQRAYSGAWGTPAQLMDPSYAAAMFFGLSPAGAPANHARGLTQIPGWETMPLGEAAQKVQVSAYPDRYAQWEQAASDIVAAAAGVQVSGDCSTALISGSTDASDTYGPYWASFGRPEGIDPWSFYWGECVSYAAWQVRTTSKYSDFTNNWRGQHFGNAKEWVAAATAAGLVVNQTPAVGSIAVHLQGPGKSYPNGHVAYVTQVYPTGNIDVAEYNFAGKHIFGTRTNLPALSQFDWFIHFEQ